MSMKKVNKILFIRLQALGDIVLTESTIRMAKQFYPDCQIHYLTKPDYAELVESFTNIDKVIRWRLHFELLSLIKSENYTYIIDLQNNLSTFLLKMLISFKKVITYNNQLFLKFLIIKKLTKKSINSVVFNYINTLQKLTQSNLNIEKIKKNKSYYPILNIDQQKLERVKEIFKSYKLSYELPIIGIFSGAKKKGKMYPLEKLANFILSFPEDFKCNFVIIGEYKEKIHTLILRGLTDEKLYDLTGVFTIAQLPAVISLLDYVVTNDTGPMHIAAALQKKQIAIFGCTHTSLGYRPLNDNAVVVEKNLKCQPCTERGTGYCKKRHFPCLLDIHSSEVYYLFQKKFHINDIQSQ